jgi:excisionase family DNA binding protein
MNKKEASEYLGISIRQIENYARNNELSVGKEKGKTGNITVYDERELETLKQKLDAKRTFKPSVVREDNESNEIVRSSDSHLTQLSKFAELLTALVIDKNPSNTVAIENKPLLKLDEAAALTGLSRDTLRDAIETKDLIGKKIGRAFRIKRDDLDEYIKNL